MITQVQREELEASLNLQLSSANANFNQALAAFNISKENVAFARKIRDRTYIKYQEGMATSFELTQSESQLITDQFNLVGAALNLFEAKTQIDQILNN
jgi:outer membrane protein TolC